MRGTVKDIPISAIFEHYALQEAYNMGNMLRPSQEAAAQLGFEHNIVAPFSETRILTLLYCLLVFPHELWKKERNLKEAVAFLKGDPDLPNELKDLCAVAPLRHLRNATAHADIEFADRHVTLRDKQFCRRLSYESAITFLLHLGRAFHRSRPDVIAALMARHP